MRAPGDTSSSGVPAAGGPVHRAYEMSMLDRFSHGVRNNLQVLLCNAQYLLETKGLTEEQTAAAQDVMLAARAIARAVNGIEHPRHNRHDTTKEDDDHE